MGSGFSDIAGDVIQATGKIAGDMVQVAGNVVTSSIESGSRSKATGIDLNDGATGTASKAMARYEYDPEYGGGNYDYTNSGEVKPPPEVRPVEVEPSNEFTNNEIRDSLDSDSQNRKSLAKEDAGIDLNDATTVASKELAKDTANNEGGEDLNGADAERLDATLENFQEDKWSDLPLEEQKQSMTDLADYVAADTGNKNPPEIVFRDDMEDGMYGGYSPDTNTIEINQNMLDDSAEAADTITHEMWHAHQQQCAADPSNERSAEYQEAFDNYISPEYDFEGYENQMVEAEARDYAQGFKDRLAGM